jgi:hypothetical protein
LATALSAKIKKEARGLEGLGKPELLDFILM